MIEGRVLFVDRDNVNTDEIIPAKYLNAISKAELKPHLFEDLDIKGFSQDMIKDTGIVFSRANFGCGSSREHAPWALQINGIHAVVASGFARIFRQNMFNCGLIPVELLPEDIEDIFSQFSSHETICCIDPGSHSLTVDRGDGEVEYQFELSDFHLDLIQAGGWVEYTEEHY